jgi:hypothetical protein
LKIWKKNKSNSEKIWKIKKKIWKKIVKWFGKYGRKVSRIVIRYRQHGFNLPFFHIFPVFSLFNLLFLYFPNFFTIQLTFLP